MAGIDEPFIIEYGLRLEFPGVTRIAGIDEVGRGPLAGPVVVAAVVLPDDFDLPVNDSKKLSEKVREELATAIREDDRIEKVIVMRTPAQIDQMNILAATQDAMREAATKLSPLPHYALIDGLGFHPFPCPARFVIKGDSKSASIAAASILAKSTRDNLMVELDKQYPGYGFASHKGYGTAEHLSALQKLGPCPAHRLTFGPVAQPTLNFLDP